MSIYHDAIVSQLSGARYQIFVVTELRQFNRYTRPLKIWDSNGDCNSSDRATGDYENELRLLTEQLGKPSITHCQVMGKHNGKPKLFDVTYVLFTD